jgi:hypothetical protein
VFGSTKRELIQMAKKPNVSKIAEGEWIVRYRSGLVKVELAEVYLVNVIGSEYEICSADTYGAFPADFYRVTNVYTGKVKTFYGEMARFDARRFASDLDFACWVYLD